MYVWAAFEAKSPPTRQDLVTLININTLYFYVKQLWRMSEIALASPKPNKS